MKVLILLLILVFGAIIGYFKSPKNSKTLKTLEYEKAFLSILPEINRLWAKARWEDAPECGVLLGLDPKLDRKKMSCNPVWMNCALQGKELEKLGVQFSFTKTREVIKGVENFLTYSSKQIDGEHHNNLYKLEIQADRFSKAVFLEDSCHQVYLPQRTYLDENSNRSESIYWDNLGRFLYIDRFMFTNWEYAYLTKSKIDLKKAMEVYKSSSKTDQKKLCLKQGKRLLTSRLFNAISTIPLNLSQSNPRFLKNSFDPWSRYESRSPLNQIDENTDDWDQIKIQICSNFKFKDCENENYLNTPSWMGVVDLFNGIPHRLNNEFFPNESIVGIHNTRDLEKNLHLFSRQEETKEIEVGFRCYQELTELDK